MHIGEIQLTAEATEAGLSNACLISLLTCQTTYAKKFKFLKGIIGAPKLAATATKGIQKFKTDYKIGYNTSFSYHYIQRPQEQGYIRSSYG